MRPCAAFCARVPRSAPEHFWLLTAFLLVLHASILKGDLMMTSIQDVPIRLLGSEEHDATNGLACSRVVLLPTMF